MLEYLQSNENYGMDCVMFKKIDNLMLIFIVLFALSCAVYPCFAVDNQTALDETDNGQLSESITEPDVLSGNNDYYFDASLENDTGDGSADNPYKYLNASRIRANSNIHLANGNMTLTVL